jgi:hypothetical protein
MCENLQQLFLNPDKETKLLALQLCKSQGLEEEFKYYRYVLYLCNFCPPSAFEFSEAEKWIVRLDTYPMNDTFYYSSWTRILEQIWAQAVKILPPEALAQGSLVFDWYEFLNAFMHITLFGAQYVFQIQAENKVSRPLLRKNVEAWMYLQNETGYVQGGVLKKLSPPTYNHVFTLKHFCSTISLEGLRVLASSNLEGHLDLREVEILEIPAEFAQATQIQKVSFSVFPNQFIKGLEHLKHIQRLELNILDNRNHTYWEMGEEWGIFDNLEQLIVAGKLRLECLSKNIIRHCKNPAKFRLQLTLPQNTDLPKNMEYFVGIKSLSLSAFEFEKIPELLSGFKMLEHLSISQAKIATLPDWIGDFAFLKSLFITLLHLKTLPAQIAKLHNLEALRVNHNNLVKLPLELSSLKNLKYLDIANNRFKKLPPVLKTLDTVTFLNMRDNCLNSWEELESLPMSRIELRGCFKNAALTSAFKQKLAQNPNNRFCFH